jgi:hypothetical protein
MLLSPNDDFKNRTLKALPSLLEKLIYACSLRNKDGTYKHWGLSRTFGQQKADGAVGQAHTEMTTEIIRTPLREVYQQFEDAETLPADAVVLNTPPNGDELLSDHLQLIQDSVQTLADQERSRHPGA